MNKKFSTLVAALLASGGLFYAVDAMILPAGDGVAQKYVMVETRAGASTDQYVVKMDNYSAFTTFWTAEDAAADGADGSFYLKTTEKGSYLVKGDDGTIALAKAESSAQKLLFTAESETGLLKVGTKYVVIDGASLALAAEVGTENGVAAFTDAETVAETLSEGEYALGQAKLTKTVELSTANKNAKFAVNASAALLKSVNIAAWDAKSKVTIEKFTEGDYANKFYLKLGEDQYLQKDGTTNLSVVSKAELDATNSAITSDGGKLKIGGNKYLQFASQAAVLTANGSDPTNNAVYGANQAYDTDMSGKFVTDLAGTVDVNLFSPNGGSLSTASGGSKFEYTAATPATLTNETSAAYATTLERPGEAWYITPGGKIHGGCWYLQGETEVSGEVLGEGKEGIDFTLDTDGALKSGDNYLIWNSTKYSLVDAATAKDKKLYLYTGAAEIVKTLPVEETVCVIADLKTAVNNLADGTNVITATELDGSSATPGNEIPGMGDVEFDNNNNIELAEGAKALPTPIYLNASGSFISLNKAGDGLILVAAADASASASKKASWVLVDGYYMSVAMDEAGKDAKYLKYAVANSPLADTPETPATGYSLVTKANATAATFDGSASVTFGAATLNMAVSKTLSDAPATSGVQERVDAVGSGYVLLSAGDGKFITYDGNSVSTTTDPSEANALWSVKQTQAAEGAPYYYSFTNKNEKLLKIDNTTVFGTNTGFAYDKGFILTAEGKFVKIDNGAVSLDPTGSIIGLYKVGENKFAANELTVKRGHGFDVIIAVSDADDASTDIKENPFTGVLTPVNASYAEATSGNNFYLRNAAGEYIVLDLGATWGGATENPLNGDNSWNRGYKFTTVSEATFKADVVGHADKYKYVFSVSHSAGVAAKDSKEALIDVYAGAAIGTPGNVFGRLYVAELLNNAKVSYVLTTTNGFVDATKEHYPYVIFGSTNMAKQTDLAKGKFITVSKKTDIAHKLDGFTQVLTVVTDVKNQTTATFVDVDNAVADTLPAAQWAVKVAGTNGITLTNREFPAVTYTQFGNGLYTIENKANDFAVASALTDTVRIKFHDKVSQYDGYANFDEIDVRDNLFRIGLISPVFGETAYLSENHGTDHQLGFVKDEKEATEWTLAKMTNGRHMEKVTKTDTIYVISTSSIWKDSKWQTKDDTLKITPFYFINSKNDEAVIWGKDAENTNPSGANKYPEAYICNPQAGVLTSTAQAFVLKKNGKGYNLIAVNYDGEAKLNNYTWNTLNQIGQTATYLESLNKIYAGVSSDKGITNRDYSYRKTENDIFSVTPVTAEMYRKVAMGDTIKIAREDNEADVLFEKGYKEGDFLARVNDVQFPKTAPAMYVDTAYVDRAKNNRWEYLLVVNPERKIVNDDCGVPSHEKFHADTTYGRFLVNLIDSANIYNQSQQLHNNKYVNSEGYAKLAFVPGYHTHDTLYLDCVKHVVDTISLDRQVNAYGVEKAPRSVAKFAFRIIDQATKSFVIETQYKQFAKTTEAPAYEGAPGYLKWMNDYVVVVPNIKDADVFNMTENYEGAPTANEDVTVSSISVIAKEGAVTINGAASKKVTISNVLGQTIASAVLSSDNATLSAPAGIVVVAVEGEAAIKAIVK